MTASQATRATDVHVERARGSTMRSKPVRLTFLIAVAALMLGACGGTATGEPVTIRWFCCLGRRHLPTP